VYAGHAALGLLAKGKRPAIPLAFIVAVAWGPDWVEVFFSSLGNENRMLSHSLVSVGLVATVLAFAWFAYTRVAADALVVWLTYASHWPADYITGLKPTWPGGPTVGLLLYAHSIPDFLIESGLIVIGSYVYWRSLPEMNRKRAAMMLIPLGLIGFQIIFEALNGNPNFA
jgi:hypothetical protein